MNLQNQPIGSAIDKKARAAKVLKLSGKIWFIIAVLGQWFFAYYVLAYYGGAIAKGDIEAWAKVLPEGMIDGDPMGNTALAIHLLLAVIIIFFGPFQFIPWIQARAKRFHRINGRIYLITVVITSLAGLYMTWTRDPIGGLIGQIYISGDAVLILLFAFFTLRTAMSRNIKAHQNWAWRLFLAGSAVWFFRIGLMGWIIINGGPVGFDPETFTGPAITFIGFAQYLLPLAILELYLFAKNKAGAKGKTAMAIGLFALTLWMAFSIFAAVMGMWLPRL